MRLITAPASPMALGLPAGNTTAADRHAADLRRRKRDLLSSLLGLAGPTRTYDLRVISFPDQGYPSAGRITLALLIRLDDSTAVEAERHARECLGLLQSTFPEGESKRVAFIAQGMPRPATGAGKAPSLRHTRHRAHSCAKFGRLGGHQASGNWAKLDVLAPRRM